MRPSLAVAILNNVVCITEDVTVQGRTSTTHSCVSSLSDDGTIWPICAESAVKPNQPTITQRWNLLSVTTLCLKNALNLASC